VKHFTHTTNSTYHNLTNSAGDTHSLWHVIGDNDIVNQIFKCMLRWTLTFLVIAVIAAVFGFTGIAAGAASIAKIIFYIFLVFLVVSLLAGAFRRTD
jgi:uncharacterized membrane protein YtjA (UPF0391 family)